MTIADILIWESSNLFPIDARRDWVFLIGHPREKIFSLHLWLKLGMLWFTVVLIGLAGGYICSPMDFHCSCPRFLSPGL
jgi:hypothetical protein